MSMLQLPFGSIFDVPALLFRIDGNTNTIESDEFSLGINKNYICINNKQIITRGDKYSTQQEQLSATLFRAYDNHKWKQLSVDKELTHSATI